MSLSFRSSSFLTASGSEEPDTEAPVSSTALDFLATLATSHLEFYTSLDLGLHEFSFRLAGKGGYATIEVGTARKPHKCLVAVKRSRIPSAPFPDPQGGADNDRNAGNGGLGRVFEQLVRELRILAHEQMRTHANIVDVLGICADDLNGSPILALVLEYSSLGSLASFLAKNRDSLSEDQRVDFILQASQGLAALHKLKVCHADVKVENALVFPLDSEEDGNRWRIKISDFGQSIIASRDDPLGRVPCRAGTRLLDAPEIRRGHALHDPCYDIEAALRTDVFSFGLFAWEVLKNGQRFFNPTWIGPGSERFDVDAAEECLNVMPEDKLLSYALDFVKELEHESAVLSLSLMFEGSLRDQPLARKSMSELAGMLEPDMTPTMAVQDEDDDTIPQSIAELLKFLRDDDQDSGIAAWSSRNSLYEVMENALLFGSHDVITRLPMAFQQRILSELKALAVTSDTETSSSGYSALTVSECYTLGIGDSPDTVQVVLWLATAASRGCEKAGLWYHRVCIATGTTAQSISNTDEGERIERSLADTPTEKYLMERIHHHNDGVIRAAQQSIQGGLSSSLGPNLEGITLSVFNAATVDELLPLHVACWLGEEALVMRLLESTAPDVTSALGFGAAHFACLGGHLSVLKILLERNVSLLSPGFRSITALHLAIFFHPDDLPVAMDLMLEHGCSLEATIRGEVKWDAHDLLLSGTPLEWAITVRYSALTRLLLKHQADSPQFMWICKAIGHFYWDILEDLLPYFKDVPDISNTFTRLQTITRPFRHWIAHGADHIRAIRETVRICHENGLLGFEADGSSHLETILCDAKTADDLYLIDSILSVSSASYVRHKVAGPLGYPAIALAFNQAGRREAWYKPISKMADFYSLAELEDGQIGPFGSLLGEAAAYDCLAGVRVLLERGVDVNKPFYIMGRVMAMVIHQCIGLQSSPEMLSLLIEYGADLLAKDPVARLTPLHWLLQGRIQTDDVLRILLQRDQPEQVYIEALHRTFCSQFIELVEAHIDLDELPNAQAAKGSQFRVDRQEQFRRLLTHPRFARYIDSTKDEQRTTMIQQAAYVLHAPSVRLLLDAGADAGRPFHHGSHSALPLQLACAQARGLFDIERDGLKDIETDPDFYGEAGRDQKLVEEGIQMLYGGRMGQAMQVATELLRWHAARGDGLFEGITELHLACSMGDRQSMSRLLQQGMSPNAKGRWPGIEEMVTPTEIISLVLGADTEVALEFPVPEFGSEMPIPEAAELLEAALIGD